MGAIYVQKGFSTLLTWISRLVSPESEPLAAPGANPATGPQPPPPYTSSSPPVPPSVPPPPMPPSQSLSGLPQVNTLALFNQTCAQRGLVINWESESEGPAHQPRWAVKCFGEHPSHSTLTTTHHFQSTTNSKGPDQAGTRKWQRKRQLVEHSKQWVGDVSAFSHHTFLVLSTSS